VNISRIIVLLALVMVPASLLAIDIYPVQRVVFPNGLTLIAKVDKRSKVASVHTLIGTGWANDKKGREGLHNILIKALAKGGEKYTSDELGKKLEDLACTIDARCDRETSSLKSTVLAECLLDILKVHSDLIKFPDFKADEVESLKTSILLRLKKSKRHPTISGYGRNQFRTLLYGVKHPYSGHIYGTSQSLRYITAKDLAHSHTHHFKANSVVISIVGNFDFNEVVKEIMKLYAPLQAARLRPLTLKAPKKVEKLKRAIEEHQELKDITNKHVYLGFQGPALTHHDFFPMALLQVILTEGRTSILGEKFAEKPEVSNLQATMPKCLGSSDFTIQFQLEGHDVDSVVALILGELEKLKRRKLSIHTIERSRRLFKNIYSMTAAGTETQSYLLGSAEVLDAFEFYELYFEKFDEVTPDDIMAVAQKYFGIDKYALLTLCPEGKSSHKGDEYAMKEFDNGLTVVVKPEPGSDSIGMLVGFASGSYTDPVGKTGLNTLLFNVLNEGAVKDESTENVVEAVEELGAFLQCRARRDGCIFVGQTSKFFFREYLDLVYKLYTKPSLEGESYKRVKEDILLKIDSIKESPSDHLGMLIYEKLFPRGHKFGKNKFGTSKSVTRITPKDLKRFHKKYFVPSNTTIIIVGDVSPEKIFRSMKNNFAALPSSKLTLPMLPECPNLLPSSATVLSKDSAANSFEFGFLIPEVDKNFARFSVIGDIYGWGTQSELYKTLTKNNYSVSDLGFHIELRGNIGVARFSCQIEEGDMKALPAVIAKMVKKAKKRSFSDEVISRTRRKLATVMAIQGQNKIARCGNLFYYHKAKSYKSKSTRALYLDKLPELYKNVTKKDLKEVVSKYFNNYQLLITEKK